MRRLLILLALILSTTVVSAEQIPWWLGGRPKPTPETTTGGGGGGGGACPNCLTGAQIFSATPCGYRMPGTFRGQWGDTAPGAIAFNDAATDTLYVASRGDFTYSGEPVHAPVVANLGFPSCNTYVSSNGDLAELTYTDATGWADPIEGAIASIDGCTAHDRSTGSCNPASLTGILVQGGRLYGTYGITYDASNGQLISHFSRPLNLATTGQVKGPDRYYDGVGSGHVNAGGPGYTGFTAGYIAPIPSSRQASFGGHDMVSGWCCPSIIDRTSYGPGLGAFTSSLIGSGGTQPYLWDELVLYPGEHQTLGAWLAASPYFNVSTSTHGVVIIDGTDTVAFFGQWGETFCYGLGGPYTGTDPASSNFYLRYAPGTIVQLGDLDDGISSGGFSTVGDMRCYDPSDNNKANHGYPNHPTMWLYNINDLLAVYNGTTNPATGQAWKPWDVVPYEKFEVPFPVNTGSSGIKDITGATWDPVNRRLYLSQSGSDLTHGTAMGLVWRWVVPSI